MLLAPKLRACGPLGHTSYTFRSLSLTVGSHILRVPFLATSFKHLYDTLTLTGLLLVVHVLVFALICCFRLFACQCMSPPPTLRCKFSPPPAEPIQKTEHLGR